MEVLLWCAEILKSSVVLIYFLFFINYVILESKNRWTERRCSPPSNILGLPFTYSFDGNFVGFGGAPTRKQLGSHQAREQSSVSIQNTTREKIRQSGDFGAADANIGLLKRKRERRMDLLHQRGALELREGKG